MSLVVKPCSALQLTGSHSDLTARSWLCGITTTEVQQKPLMSLVSPPLTHRWPMPPVPPKAQVSHPRAAAKCPIGATPMWDFGKEHQASAYPPSATQISQVNRGEDTEDVLVQKSTWFPKTPIRNFRQLNRFLSPAGQILSLKDVKHSMVVITQLQQHIKPKANLAYKYVILFHVSVSVMKSRKSRL